MELFRGLATARPGRVFFGGGALIALNLLVGQAHADPYTVTVKGNGTALGETPIVLQLDAMHGPSKHQLKASADAPGVPAQIYHQGGKSYLAFVLKHVPAKGDLTFSFESNYDSDRPGTGVEFRRIGSNLEVLTGGKPLTVYRTDEPTKSYYYPVIGPTGAEFTRAYPMKPDVPGEDHDHPHQRSLWFTFGDVDGYDFWASDPINKPSPKFGSIRETWHKVITHGTAVGVLKSHHEWLKPDGKRLLEEERVVRFYDTAGARVMDFDITLIASYGPVTFNDTKEGMFGLRVASSMDVVKGKTKGAGKITNAEGLTDEAAWGKPSPWVDYVGPVAGKTVGVAILNHPTSLHYPTPWHVRTYGLFAANPFGSHDFGGKERVAYTLPQGEQVRFGYRIILHEGDTSSAHIADAFKAYASPPAVTLHKE